MLKASLVIALLAQGTGSQMAQRMEAACTGYCHGPSLIAQQRLDRDGWTREVEKMMRWGADVAPAEKDALINYLTMLFNSSRPRPNTSKMVPEGKGKDVFQISCMSCHDDKPVTSLKRDRAGWTREVEKMINWGAYVPANRKEELIEYLITAFSNS
jgi:hypothetical protein